MTPTVGVWGLDVSPASPVSRMNRMADTDAPVRVLLVEDHPDVAEVTLLMLRHLGAEAEHASTAAEALELASKQRFDLLLADMRLPDGSGADVIRQVSPSGSNPRPVLLTAYGVNDIIEGTQGLNCERMSKPIEMDRLQTLLEECRASAA